MKKIYSIVIAAAILISSCTADKKEPVTSLVQFADSLFQSGVDSSYIAGASVIVYMDGEMLLDRSYGYASLELSVPIPDNASFEIGSVTKQLTSAAILRLVEAGELSLEDDFTKYLDFDSRGRVITINNLLNHTSGIASYTELPEFRELSVHRHERDSLVRLVEQKDFFFEPGEAMIYNNSGYFFLGLIIEEVTGMSYEEYLREQFFEPLGMNNTYYSSNSEVIPGKVYGYAYSSNRLLQRSYLDHTWPYAAGSLASSTKDLLTWMKALHEGALLSDSYYRLMITPGELKDGSALRYAMGLINYSDFSNRVIGHGGGINGFLSDTRYYPDNNLYIICLVNTTGPMGASYFAEELTWKILERKEHEKSDIDINLESLEGRYSGQARGRVLSVDVSALSDGIVISMAGRETADTLRTYTGDNTWMHGNQIIRFTEDECRIDDISGYFILKKQ